MPRAAESSRAGNTVDARRRKQRCTRANAKRPGARARRTGRQIQERPRRGTFGPGSFSVPESPNRRVEEVSGTAYAALTPHLRPLTYNPPAMQLFQDCLCPQTA